MICPPLRCVMIFKLDKKKDKDFKILNLTDIQIYEKDIRENSDELCFLQKTVDELVSRTCPDLITVSGDITNGDGYLWQDVYRFFAEYMNGFGIPWTVVWGNHDNQGGKENISAVVDMYMQYSGFIYDSGDPELGNGNFVISIEEGGAPVSALIMMDSHDRTPHRDKADAWARLNDRQLVWYREQVEHLTDLGCKSNAVILHIPIYAYRDAYDAAATDKLKELSDARKITFSESCLPEYWNDGYKDSYGLKFENICSYLDDEGLMDIIDELGKTKLVLCGHDHINSFSIKYRGVELMYSLKTGKGCYYNQQMNGGTVITINSAGDIKAEHLFILE